MYGMNRCYGKRLRSRGTFRRPLKMTLKKKDGSRRHRHGNHRENHREAEHQEGPPPMRLQR